MIASTEVFLDTNVLLYAALASVDEAAKYERAVELLTTRFGTSGQVLAEFYVNAQRKGSVPLTADEAREWVVRLSKKAFQPVDSAIVRGGIDHARRYQLSYWDGAIIAAAERLGARPLFRRPEPWPDLRVGPCRKSLSLILPQNGTPCPSSSTATPKSSSRA